MTACVVGAASLCFSASASSANNEGPASNVWIDVVELSSEMRLSVTVPFSYGFAVLGTTETNTATANEAISTANGNLYLPNVRVNVSTSSSWTVTGYQLTYTGTIMPLENYSTDVREENTGQTDPEREGLPVELRPYIVETDKTNFWKASSTPPTSDGGDFKKYRMLLDGKPFSEESQRRNADGTLIPVVEISDIIALPAPPDVPTNGYTAAGTANVPSRTDVPVDVEIGGRRGQYHQVEHSIKVAQIYWEVIPGDLPPLP